MRTKKKKLLFIAPLPPPVNGQSKASKVVLQSLQNHFEVEVINLSKSSLKNGLISLGRIWEILVILIEVWKKRNNQEYILLSLAESFAGNMRDLLIYYILRKDLEKIFVQMLGGAGMKQILSGNNWQKKANARVLKHIAGVIVEGPVNFNVFKKIIPENKIHIVQNFAEDYLFVSEAEIKSKFDNLDEINILFLSNLLPGKGYLELANAYISLSIEDQEKIQINFVGGFESSKSENEFLEKIILFPGMNYLGKFINGAEKKELYCRSHVFCLPTYYAFEGQPISILEAYATGCAVITTNHSGIPFVFVDKENGYLVQKKSVASLTAILKLLIVEKEKLVEIGIYNNRQALLNYRTSTYKAKISSIFTQN